MLTREILARKAVIISSAIVLATTMAACSSELPDKGNDSADQAPATVAPAATSQSTITITVSADKTLAPDDVSFTLTMPTKAPEVKDGETPRMAMNDFIALLKEDGVSDEQMATSESGDNTVIEISHLSLLDAKRVQRDAQERMNATISNAKYDVSDPSSIKKEAIKEAFDKSQEEVNMVAEATGVKALNPIAIEEGDIETVAQTEEQVTVRVSLHVTYTIE